MQRFHFCIFLQLVVGTSEEGTVWYLAREPVVIFKENGKGAPGDAVSFNSMRRRYLYTRSAAHERQVNKVKVWVWVWVLYFAHYMYIT